MDKKTTDIVAYLSWIGFLIALLAGDKENSKFHLNQALVIMLFSFLVIIPCLGWIWGIFMIVCWFMGLISAINGEEKPVPVVGKIVLIKQNPSTVVETEVESSTNDNLVQSDEEKTDL